MTFIQQQIDFTVHAQERTTEGTAHIQKHSVKLSTNCRLLVSFWQSKWYWLSDDDSRSLVGVRNITQRVADIRHVNGIPVESKYDDSGKFKRYRLKCTCHIVSGEQVVDGCYVHDPKLRIL